MEKIFDHWEIIAGALGSIVAFIAGRGKRNAEVKQASEQAEAVHLKNINEIFRIQGEQIAELEKQFEKRLSGLRTYLKELDQDKQELKSLIESKQNIIEQQRNIIENQRKMLEECQQKLDEQRELIKRINKSLDYYKRKYGQD